MHFEIDTINVQNNPRDNMSAIYCFVLWWVHINIRTLREECILINIMFNKSDFQLFCSIASEPPIVIQLR